MNVIRTPYPADQTPLAPAQVNVNRVASVCYCKKTGGDMFQIRQTNLTSPYSCRKSSDNGLTWRTIEQVPAREPLKDGLNLWRSPGPIFLEPGGKIMIRFWRHALAANPWFEAGNFTEKIQALQLNSEKVFYQASNDGGENWGEYRQVIAAGDEYDTDHWAPDVHVGKSTIDIPFITPPLIMPDGCMLMPYFRKSMGADKAFKYLAPGTLKITLVPASPTPQFEFLPTVPGGGCEPTIAALSDGRLFMIIRRQGVEPDYHLEPGKRPYSISNDGGRSWSRTRALAYDDGEPVKSPTAMSHLLRSSQNGKLYWCANILKENTPLSATHCDPRHPFQIAEIDEASLRVKKSTLTIIEDKRPNDPELVRFSNARIYEDRNDNSIIIIMMRHYAETIHDVPGLDCPNHLYRITV